VGKELSSWGDKKHFNWVIPISQPISFRVFKIHIHLCQKSGEVVQMGTDVVDVDLFAT